MKARGALSMASEIVSRYVSFPSATSVPSSAERIRPDVHVVRHDEPLDCEPVDEDRPNVVQRDVLAAVSGNEAAYGDAAEGVHPG